MSDFDLLIQNGNIGFYNTCEVTTAFIYDRQSKQSHNFYTIFVMEERIGEIPPIKYLIPSLIQISNQYSFGIIQYHIDLTRASTIYNDLNVRTGNVVDFTQGSLYVDKLTKLPKQFIPPDSTTTPIVNKALKNNFRNGSYTIEFSDTDKSFYISIPESIIRKMSLLLLDHLPIDLFVLSDRVGSVIFQFPINILSLTFSPNKQDHLLEFQICFDKRVNLDREFTLSATNKHEDAIVGFGIHNHLLASDSACTIQMGDSGGLNHVQLIDNCLGLIIYMCSTSFMAGVSMAQHFGTRFGSLRAITDNKGNETQIDIHSRDLIQVPYKRETTWKSLTSKRQYQMNLNKLERQKKFIQYGINENQRDKALNDLRTLIHNLDSIKIYLWDPYLTADDTLNTLYYAENFGAELKAITSSLSCNGMSLHKWIELQKEAFEKRSNNYGINLEFRIQHDMYGFGFHDRFLMFINDNNIARVWSLGTSVNSLGTSHHILHEVDNPQHIVDAFDVLWNQLDDKTCLVWKRTT